MTRRELLRAGGALGLLAAAGSAIWLAPKAARAASARPLLVVIFQRGGADALALLPPVGDANHTGLRGGLAVERRDALAFDAGFGLHPALAALGPLVERGELAAVPAAGSPDPSRSHFEAQDLMELGGPDAGHEPDGWLTRAFGRVREGDLFGSLSVGSAALSLRGSGAIALADPRVVALGGASLSSRRALRDAYAGVDDAAGVSGVQALQAAEELRHTVGSGARRGRGTKGGFSLSSQADLVLALEESGLDLEAVTLENSGWDTHTGQSGALSRLAADLAESIVKLVDGVRARRDVRVVCLTEFGRTVRPNGSGGTDHGHGGAIWLAGTRVRGGVRGEWPGLGDEALHEGRDLPVANDYRSVLSEVLRAHRGSAPGADVFPRFSPSPLGLFS